MRRPLSQRSLGANPEWDGPFEGVPDWLGPTLQNWVRRLLIRNVAINVISTPLFQSTQRQLRVTLDWGGGALSAFDQLMEMGARDHTLILDVVDLCLAEESDSQKVNELELALFESGSAWTVGRDGEGQWELQRRVGLVVGQLTQTSATPGSRADQHLARAWSAVYGRDPSPSEGYREAVRGVECVAIAVVSPNNARATLGTVIGDMKTARGKWTTSLNPAPPLDDVTVVIGMMELLWKSQLDRHGSPDPAAPLNVSQQEAEAALHLAGTLVHWFDSGVVTLCR